MRLLRVVAVALMVIVLASCSVTIKPRDNSKPTPTPDTTRSAFLSDVRDHYPVFDDYDGDKLVKLAKAACRSLDRGATGTDLAKIIVDKSPPKYQKPFGYTVGAGVRYYCPENAAQLRK